MNNSGKTCDPIVMVESQTSLSAPNVAKRAEATFLLGDVNKTVKNMVANIFDTVITKDQAQKANQTSSLLQLPELALVRILEHVGNNIDPSNQDYASIESACTALRKSYKDFKSMGGNVTTILTDKAIKDSFTNFIKQTSPFWHKLHEQKKWVVIQIYPIVKYRSQNKLYHLIFSLGMAFHPVVDNGAKSATEFFHGDNNTLLTYKSTEKIEKAEKDEFSKFLGTCADAGATYMKDRINIASNAITMELKQVNTEYYESSTSPKIEIAYVMNVFDYEPGSQVNKFQLEEFNKVFIEATSINPEKLVKNISDQPIQHSNVSNIIAKAQYHLKDSWRKTAWEMFDVLPLMINWFGAEDSKLVIKQTCAVGYNGGGKHVNTTPKLFEKRIILGRERNVYKSGNKLYIKNKGQYIGLKEFLKQR